MLVQATKTIVSQHTVLIHQRHDVRGDTHHQQIQQRQDLLKGDAVALGVGLYQLKTDTTPRQLVEGVGAIVPLGIQDGYGLRNLLGRKMVVANDEIDPLTLCIDNLLGSLDSAVQGDDQRDTLAGGVINTLARNTVSLRVAVGDIEREVFVSDLAQELVDQSHRSGSIHVIISVHHNLLAISDGLLHALNRLLHILHQEGIVQVSELRVEELTRSFYGVYASLCE